MRQEQQGKARFEAAVFNVFPKLLAATLSYGCLPSGSEVGSAALRRDRSAGNPVQPSEAGLGIRVVGRHMHDNAGQPFAIRGIESMYWDSHDHASFVSGQRALGANSLGPLVDDNAKTPEAVEELLREALEQGMVVGLNSDHTGEGHEFFLDPEMAAIINAMPHVFLQQAIELGDESEDDWVEASKQQIDRYVGTFPTKPLKLGSPFGGRNPMPALARCEEVVDYYYEQGGSGGVLFTWQVYWEGEVVPGQDWYYQWEFGLEAGLEGTFQAIDLVLASPCMFLIGLDNNDDVGYTGWREIMDYIRDSNPNPQTRLGYQWWVLENGGDGNENELTDDAYDALNNITPTGEAFKAKVEADRVYPDLGSR